MQTLRRLRPTPLSTIAKTLVNNIRPKSTSSGDDEWNDAWETAWLPEDLSAKNRAPWETDVNFGASAPPNETSVIFPSDVDAEDKAFVEEMDEKWNERKAMKEAEQQQQQQQLGNNVEQVAGGDEVKNMKKDYRLKKQRIHAGLWMKEIEKEEEARFSGGGDDIDRLLDSCSEIFDSGNNELINSKIPSTSEFKTKPDGWETTTKAQDGNIWDISQREEDILLQEFERRIAFSKFQGMASPVMKSMLKQSKSRDCRRSITIRGVPHQAVRTFIRFLYSSCYEEEEMKKFVLHLLVLSHVFVIPRLKQECVRQLEKGLLTHENVVDIFQLARLCDAPRLSLISHRLIMQCFKAVSASEGWKIMKLSNPKLEKELLESLIETDSRKQDRSKKVEERKIYLQLYEAMEALVHICREGCRTIGPHDKVLKASQAPCNFPACKGIESLVRHFAGCKTRVPGGCVHCKRMWQLLELHSRLCSKPDVCKVPLCRHFKEKTQYQNKKDEVKWKLLVTKVLGAKNMATTPLIKSPLKA